MVGLALARTNLNSWAIRGGAVTAGPGIDPDELDAEYAAELYYSLHPTRWLELRPNVQGIHHPGGGPDMPAVVVLSLKGAVTL